VRGGSILLTLYALAVLNLATSGLNVDAGLFSLAFVAMTALLVGLRGGLAALAVSGITLGGFGVAIVTGRLALGIYLPQADPLLWIIGGTILLLMGTLLTISLTALLRGLQSSLDKASALTAELAEEQVFLRQRTQDLERRSVEIRTAAEISRIISAVLKPQELLQKVVNLIQERFDLYYAGVFLLDEYQHSAVLQAGSGEAGRKMVAEGHRLPIGDSSMIGWTIARRQARIALDVGLDAVRFANPHLPLTRSELALPLMTGERVLGALTIQSTRESAFDRDDITVLQGIADTLAVALENARLFSELDANLREIRTLHSQYLLEAWSGQAGAAGEMEFTFGAPTLPGAAAVDVPLTLREQIIGQLRLESDADWSPEDRNLIEAVATQAALALENARLLDESQQIALQERLISEITGKIWASLTIDGILQTTIKELGRAFSASEGSIHLEVSE
jgi:GAF domain-containing protein